MAARFWVTGGTGNWNSTTNWSATTGGASGASVPSTSDTATYDASSGAGTATLDISPTIQTLTMTGFTGTLAFGTNTISLNSTGTIFTGATTMTVTGTPLIICTDSSATSRTISPGAVTEANSISFRFTAGTGSLTVSTGAYRDLDFTDGVNPTGFAGAFSNNVQTVYGNFKASTGMTRVAGASALTFAATSGTKTINTAGVTFDCPFTFDGVGGTFQLVAALTSGSSRTATLTNGTLDFNGFTLTTGIFTGPGSGVRKFANNTASIIVTGNAATVVSFGTTTNFTADFTPVFELNYSGSVGTRSVSWGSSNLLYVPNINVTAGSDIVTTSGTTTVNNFNFTGFTGTLGNATRNIYGNLTLVSGMATPSSGSLVTSFTGVSSQTITTAGKTLDFPITFDGVGGTFQLQDALTSGATRTCTLTNGTLDLNNFTLTTGFFSSTNSNTRAIAFGTGKIVLTGTGATVWTNATGTGFTYTGTSRIEAPGPSTSGTRTFNPSTASTSTEAIALNFYVTGGSDTVTFSTTNRRVNIIDFTGFTGTFRNSSVTAHGNYTLAAGMTLLAGTETTIFATTTSQTITTAGQTLDFPITFDGVGGTFQLQDALTSGDTRTATLTNGTLNLNNFTLTTGLFSSSNSNTRVLAFGTGKIVLTGTSGSIFTTSTSTNFTVTGTNPLIQATAGGAGTRTITMGTGSEANAISVDVTSGSDIVSVGTTSGAYKNVNFTGFTGTVSIGNSIFVFGNWNYGGTTIQGTGAGTVTFSATSGTQTITSNGFSFPGNVTFNGVGGTFQLQDALTAVSTVTLTSGTLDLNNFTLTTNALSSTSGTTRTLAFGTAKIVLTGNDRTVISVSTGTALTITGSKRIELSYSGGVGTRTITGTTTSTAIEGTNLLDYFITAGTDIIIFSGARASGTIDFSNSGTSTFTGTWQNTSGNSFSVYGDLILNATMVVGGGDEFIIMRATSGTKTITSAGQTLDFPFNINGSGGTFSCFDALTLGSTREFRLTDGTLQFKAGTTNTVGSFTTTGTDQKFLQSTTPGTRATLSQASGTVSVNYLTIQDSNATGGAVFEAPVSSFNVNSGNNLGWDFTVAAVGGSGNAIGFGFGFRI